MKYSNLWNIPSTRKHDGNKLQEITISEVGVGNTLGVSRLI